MKNSISEKDYDINDVNKQSKCNESDGDDLEHINEDNIASDLLNLCNLIESSKNIENDLVKKIDDILYQKPSLATDQKVDDGKSALIIASQKGLIEVVKILLRHGAVWNALDRFGKCAGNYASELGHQDLCDLLVEHAVRCEFLLGRVSKRESSSADKLKDRHTKEECNSTYLNNETGGYLQTNVEYSEDGSKLLDSAGDGVMMEWEEPLMRAHAQIITGSKKNKRVLNIGFGLGIIDGILQNDFEPTLHVIIEAHPGVYNRMKGDGWLEKKNVRVMYGRWQDELPKLVQEGLQFDGIFFDTYGEHWSDMEEFHGIMVNLLAKSETSIYSFFNGLSPDNIFFHGVACECARIQLSTLDLVTEFAPCDIQINDDAWKGVARKYWHGSTYYLPICSWNPNVLKS